MTHLNRDLKTWHLAIQKCVQNGLNGVNGFLVLSHAALVDLLLEPVRANLDPTVWVKQLKKWAVRRKNLVPLLLNGLTGLNALLPVVMVNRNDRVTVLFQNYVKILIWTRLENAIYQIVHDWVSGLNGLRVMLHVAMASN